MQIKKYSEMAPSLNGGDNSMGFTNTMIRSNALPLDSKSIFNTRADAINYINSSALAYEGQVIAITEDSKQVAYLIDSEASDGLRRIGHDSVKLCADISSIAKSYADNAILSVKTLSDNISADIMNLSSDIKADVQVLSNNVDAIWDDIRGGVNYKGHFKTLNKKQVEGSAKNSFDLKILIARMYDNTLYTDDFLSVDEFGEYYLLSSFTLNNGWMYCVTLSDEWPENSGKYVTRDNIELTDKDYIIVHDHNLSCVELSDLSRQNIDIIETQDSDYVRFSLLNAISNALSIDYINKITDASCNINSKIDILSTALSNEITSNVEALSTSLSNLIEFLISADLYDLSSKIDDICLSVGNISIELSNLEVSAAGISTAVTSLCTSLSTEISSNNIDIENILNYISGDNSLCTELSNVKYHYNKTFSEVRYTKGGEDLNVDVLNITNSENLALKFNLVYLSGTLVLEPII